jgi:hypothetical protein
MEATTHNPNLWYLTPQAGNLSAYLPAFKLHYHQQSKYFFTDSKLTEESNHHCSANS